MSHYDFDIGIIGGGAAGLTVASGAAQLGAKTLLVEKEKNLGGDCLHFGCVPSKTLIKTAHIRHQMNRAHEFGLPKTDLPTVDFNDIRKRIHSVISVIQEHDSVERFSGLGVSVEFGDARFINEHTISLKGGNFSAKKWVIATGTSPAIPSFEGLDKTGYITNKEIFYLDHLPKSMIVLGAGPIAMEMAQSFCRLGTKVSVIQRSGQILNKEDRDMADEVMSVLSHEGITFHLNSSVQSLEKGSNGKEALIKTGKDKNTVLIEAEEILVAMGRRPNLEGLGLEKIGVDIYRKGILVDKRLRTSLKHIYAAGDITGEYQFTHAAGYEGGVIINNAIFHIPKKTNYTFFPWCTYTDPELASIGMNEKRAKDASLDYTVWTEEFKDNDRSLAEGEKTGKIKMILDKKERPLGVQILGPHAGELIGAWVAALNGKVKLSTLASAVNPYPTLGEINQTCSGELFLS